MIEVEFSYLEKRSNWNWHQKKEIIELENWMSKKKRNSRKWQKEYEDKSIKKIRKVNKQRKDIYIDVFYLVSNKYIWSDNELHELLWISSHMIRLLFFLTLIYSWSLFSDLL